MTFNQPLKHSSLESLEYTSRACLTLSASVSLEITLQEQGNIYHRLSAIAVETYYHTFISYVVCRQA